MTELEFQSTHPRGVRRDAGFTGVHSILVSIHAPAWGATSFIVSTRTARAMFQSTHPRGVRHGQGQLFFDDGRVSIHAPAWGATTT